MNRGLRALEILNPDLACCEVPAVPRTGWLLACCGAFIVPSALGLREYLVEGVLWPWQELSTLQAQDPRGWKRRLLGSQNASSNSGGCEIRKVLVVPARMYTSSLLESARHLDSLLHCNKLYTCSCNHIASSVHVHHAAAHISSHVVGSLVAFLYQPACLSTCKLQ